MSLTKLTKVTGPGIATDANFVGNNANFTGILTAASVSIGGTLTYEDVTSIDSVGLITARSGINVSGGQLDVGSNIKLGNAGIITATSFRGDGSQLTGISVDSTKIETGNTKVETIDTGSDGHIKFTTEGSERVRIDANGNMGLGDTAPPNFTGYRNLSIHGSSGGAITFGDDGTDEWEIYGGDGSIRIYDRANTTESLRIDSDGNLSLGKGSASSTSYGRNLQIHHNGTSGAAIHLTDNNTGSGNGDGFHIISTSSIAYLWQRENANMVFGTNGAARWNIYGSNGHLAPNADSTFDIGTNSVRVRNGYFDTLYGDGSNLSNLESFNDNNIVNDISALALKVSALENSAASSTNSTYVDTFQDSNGISSFTNTTRNTSGEYISSVSPKSFYKPNQAYFTYTLSSTGTAQNGECTFAAWMKSANGSNWTYNGSQGGGIMAFESAVSSSKYLTFNIGYGSNNGKFGAHTPGLSDCNTTNAWSAPANKWVLGVVRTGYNWSTGHVEIMHRAYDAGNFTTDADSNGGTDNYGVKASGIGRLFRHASNGYTGDYDNTHIAMMGFWNESLNGTQLQALFNNGKPFDWSQNNGNYTESSKLQEYFKMDEGSGTTLTNSANGGNATLQSGSGSWDSDTQQIGSANATGNFISNTITASSSTNKMGVVITYTDTTGTATLNTDLKVSLSANNGSNYTQVTLVAQPNFATGVKMALANDVTVTAGTQLKYKVEFANQASGSKVTRVTGISLQY